MSTVDSGSKTILLNRFQFCHVLNENKGVLILHEGPCRIQLESNENLVGVFDKVRVQEGQFVIVLNPFNQERGDIVEGEREVRVGPCVFSLHPGETLDEEGVKDEFVLTDQQSLLIRAIKEAPHPDGEDKIPAGTELLIRGPRRFIPHKNIEIVEERKAIPLASDDGVFVQDNDTGAVRLVRGPEDLFLKQNEFLWAKPLTEEELQALGLKPQPVGKGTRVLSSVARPRAKEHQAVIVDLEDSEAICLFDGTSSRVEFGPKIVFLLPNERPKVLVISGDVPVRPNALKIAKLSLGPDFFRDRLVVKTNDNASVVLDVNFRWRFVVDREHPQKLFALKDFVGFAAQTLTSEIREAAAKHTFEQFHQHAAEIFKQAIFGEKTSRIFPENGFEIIGADVESVVPEDQTISHCLAESTKKIVDIFSDRGWREAQLASERRLIEAQLANEAARRELIKLQSDNIRDQELAKAEVGKATQLIQAQAVAEATRIKSVAEIDAENGKVDVLKRKLEAETEAENERFTVLVQQLSSTGGERLAEIERAKTLKTTDRLWFSLASLLPGGIRTKPAP